MMTKRDENIGAPWRRDGDRFLMDSGHVLAEIDSGGWVEMTMPVEAFTDVAACVAACEGFEDPMDMRRKLFLFEEGWRQRRWPADPTPGVRAEFAWDRPGEDGSYGLLSTGIGPGWRFTDDKQGAQARAFVDALMDAGHD